MKVTCVPPNTSPPLVTPRFTGGRPSRNSFSNLPFFFLLSGTSVCISGAWKSTIGPGEPKSADRDLGDLVLALEHVQAVLALEVRDERERGSPARP